MNSQKFPIVLNNSPKKLKDLEATEHRNESNEELRIDKSKKKNPNN